VDWELGRYERVAEQLLPATAAVLSAAAIGQGDRVLDVGCGTGNAALAAARLGASVTGVDPARRLLAVASGAAAEHGLLASFVEGTAEELPLDDGGADVVVSVFGVIFAANAGAAIAELARVTAEQGVIVMSAWVPQGALFEVMGLRRRALTGDATPASAPYAWHDAEALHSAFARFGFAVEQGEEQLAFTGDSPQAFLEDELRDHPLWVKAGQSLGAGELADLRLRALAVLSDANEDAGAFRVTSAYTVCRLLRL
jgi:ubiquinone/menaquinone biosynthesis C-methylase UbiE